MNEIKIIIADDHPIFRRGLRNVIEKAPGLIVLDEADDGNDALEKIRQLKPDIAVLDVNMPSMNGFDIARSLQHVRSAVKIVFLTMLNDENSFNAAMDLGVKGYVLKDSAVTEIVAGIKSVAAGRSYISPPLSEYVLNRGSRAAALAEEKPAIMELTPTERRILKMVSESKTSREIADILCIHFRTVENHRTNISQKLGLKGSNSLLKFALEHKSEL